MQKDDGKDEGGIRKDEIFFILHPSSLTLHFALTGISKRMKAEFRRMSGFFYF